MNLPARTFLLVLPRLLLSSTMAAADRAAPSKRQAREACSWMDSNTESWFRRAEFVCVGIAIRGIPGDTPTIDQPQTEDRYRVRVTDIWKGATTDTLEFMANRGPDLNIDGRVGEWALMWSHGPQPPLPSEGSRYLIFASRREDGCLQWGAATQDLPKSAPSLLCLSRNVGAPRQTLPDAEPIPDVSFRRIMREIENGDSTTCALDSNALAQSCDSAGVFVKPLERLLMSSNEIHRRERACFVLGRWSPSIPSAQTSILRALDAGDQTTRRVVVSDIPFMIDDELRARFFEHREDPDPEIRGTVLRFGAPFARGARPRLRPSTDALRDSSPAVREVSIWALADALADAYHGAQIDSTEIVTALEQCVDDPDPDVARSAQQVLALRAKWRR